MKKGVALKILVYAVAVAITLLLCYLLIFKGRGMGFEIVENITKIMGVSK